ncbi:MAG: [FeFe] hydrogenase H-cluster radical SAM maturase HydE [Myxococcota bacterium]|nr:[FeFe] hydrogenase H-cluster radical SAM maturase HydE [Myxococcota bacterium]
MDRDEILRWLRTTDPDALRRLWQRAHSVRLAGRGEQVLKRGLIEIGNDCRRSCLYCGLRRENHNVRRYLMTSDEIMDCAIAAAEDGCDTVVLQAGETECLTGEWVAELIERIKQIGMFVTLSLGERSVEDLAQWKDAGADRYLLRFETGNAELFERIHPLRNGPSRMDLIRKLKQLGYEVGSGSLIGVPGQRYDDLADDIQLFKTLDLDMIGTGPFVPHPNTPLGGSDTAGAIEDQVPATTQMTYTVCALARITCPHANIPSTTALAALDKHHGRQRGLACGANVLMPNFTPDKYREHYEIYPQKKTIGRQ